MKSSYFVLVFMLLLIFSIEFDFKSYTESGIIRPLTLFSLVIISLLSFIHRSKVSLKFSIAEIFFIGYLLFISLSVLITPYFEGKLNSVFGILTCYIISVEISNRFQYRQIIDGIITSVLIIVIVSWIFFIIDRSYVMNREDFFRFKGIFLHSQRLSMTLSIVIVLHVISKYSEKFKIKDYFIFIIFFITLLLTKTRANTTFLIILLIASYIDVYKKYYMLIPLFILILVFSFYDWESIAESLYSRGEGNITSLTGRSELWDALLIRINDKFLFGHGFSFFKTQPFSFSVWDPHHAHNLWLMQLYETGIIGTILFQSFLIGAFYIAIKHKRKFGYSFLLYLLLFILLSSITGLIIGGLVTPTYFLLLIFTFVEYKRTISRRPLVKRYSNELII